MTVHSSGPHILLFERDQQLTALLTSEFQLAGYECHAARTAVEVFDAIARYPIRLVLVNLAQAAAGRREFWVALDAQRRGRGVQVFTFRCMNIAGYGEDDPDDRARAVLTDMEVDGMLGVMNLVDAVRARIPGSTTGSYARVQPSTQARESAKFGAVRPASQPNLQSLSMPQAQPGTQSGVQPTAPISMPAAALAQQQPAPPQQAAMNIAGDQAPRTPTFTDKIRAVIYPGNRGHAATPEANWVPHTTAGAAPAQRVTNGDSGIHPASANMAPAAPSRQAQGIGQGFVASPPAPTMEESGLAQLSRMVQDTAAPARQPERESSPQDRVAPPPATPMLASQEREAEQISPPVELTAMSDLPLRASPIEDLPDERLIERRNGTTGSAAQQQAQFSQEVTTPTLQLAAVNPAQVRAEASVSAPTQRALPDETVQSIADDVPSPAAAMSERDRLIDQVLVPQQEQGAQQVMELLQVPALRKRSELNLTSEDVLLDIVQSLPPMNALPAPVSPQTPVLNGRATRSLANVLLEGHLVQENRLEVAQSIQRMLRGVEMNYQLGEILLMFKLLTPDQLLAASLVSYGLIAAPQISALGRIRQELHALGLEYDLESLLVLFRMLTPEQLREVRASWTA